MIIDLIIVAIIAVCVFLGYKRGLIGVAFKLISIVLAIILAVLLHGPISNFIINNTTLDERISQAVEQKIDFSKVNTENKEVIIEETNLPKVLINNFEKSIETTVDTAKTDIEKAVSQKIAESIINVAIIIILFIIIKVILLVINLVVDIISKLPVINQFNKTGGIIFGLIEGLLIVYFILAICLIASPLMQNNGILEAINNSAIGSMLYNNNVLLKFIA